MSDSALHRITELVEPSLRQLGVELYDAQWDSRGRTPVLRLVIDKPKSVGLDDCARVSNAVSAVLDAYDPIEAHYELEVTSPKTKRPLRREENWQHALGKRVNVRFRHNKNDEIVLENKLVEIAETKMMVEAHESKTLVPVSIPREKMLAARRALEF